MSYVYYITIIYLCKYFFPINCEMARQGYTLYRALNQLIAYYVSLW